LILATLYLYLYPYRPAGDILYILTIIKISRFEMTYCIDIIETLH